MHTDDLPLSNEQVALRLEEIAELLDAPAVNPFRVRAYRLAAGIVRSLNQPLHEVLAAAGWEALTELPGIGDAIARAIEKLTATGGLPLLARLRRRSGSGAILATVPGIGAKTAARIHRELAIDTLTDLELAAYDGRLAALPGIGQKRIRAVRECLAARLGTRRPHRRDAAALPDEPSVAELLSIDEEFRRKARAKCLLTVAPSRFNPTGQAWLPIMRARRDERCYRALCSNTPLAHRLGATRDWVVIYREGRGQQGQWTVVTARIGPMKGRRVVRGREAECLQHYESLPSQGSLFGAGDAETV